MANNAPYVFSPSHTATTPSRTSSAALQKPPKLSRTWVPQKILLTCSVIFPLSSDESLTHGNARKLIEIDCVGQVCSLPVRRGVSCRRLLSFYGQIIPAQRRQ